jgi:hypothetical protein
MIDIISAVLTSVLGGGATGLLGVFIQRWFDSRAKNADLQVMRLQLEAARETRAMELEAQARMAERADAARALQAQMEAHQREVAADAATYAASMSADRATYTPPEAVGKHRLVAYAMGAVDFVRGLMRPGVTAYTLALLTAVFVWVRDMYMRAGLTMTPDQVHQLAMQCVGTVFYLAVTTVVWWFGVRPAQPPGAR